MEADIFKDFQPPSKKFLATPLMKLGEFKSDQKYFAR